MKYVGEKPCHLIIGYGEVGKSIGEMVVTGGHRYRVVDPPEDIDTRDGISSYLAVHICFPYKDVSFIPKVTDIVREYPDTLIIIHSTVAIGTTQALSGCTHSPRIVHSPIRGTHPNLAQHLGTFIKFIGYDYFEYGQAAKSILSSIGFRCELVYNSKNTEAGKLFDTLYYGCCIALHNAFYELCQTWRLDFTSVVTRFNQTYNDGYADDAPHVRRPVLLPTKGEIGGHCIVPNAEILLGQLSDKALVRPWVECVIGK